MFRRAFLDPSFWLLMVFNCYCIYYYQQNPSRFYDIVWLYWGQSVLIGLFNFFDLLTVREVVPGSMTMGDKPVTSNKGKGCAALFFLIHYNFFHLVYFVFIASSTKGEIDFKFIFIGLATVSFELLVNFIRSKISQKHQAVNIGKMFFLPYLRIIPMHLMILIPAFLGVSASIVFLLLKMAADVIMYIITSHKKRTSLSQPVA